MNCILIDDEFLSLQLMQAYADKVPGLNVLAQCQGSLRALEVLQTTTPDLLLLDINMPNLNGFELLNILPDPPLVIVLSAHQEYALKGFDWDIVDFLLKPVSFERFAKAIQKARQWHQLRQSPTDGPSDTPDHFFVREEHRMVRVRFHDIRFIESFREYTHVHTSDKKLVVKRSLKSWEDILDAEKFVRVHRSYIIALDRVDAVFGNRIVIGPTEIPIGKSYKEGFLKMIELL